MTLFLTLAPKPKPELIFNFMGFVWGTNDPNVKNQAWMKDVVDEGKAATKDAINDAKDATKKAMEEAERAAAEAKAKEEKKTDA